MTLPMARDLAPCGIRALCIAPGIYNTPLVAMMPEDVKNGLAADVVFPQRLGNPEEFGDLVVTCATNAYLNGTTIRIDGAIRMPPKSHPAKSKL
jgi:NAD(P)-dependent dehydrogenase (short-subunit alcohol dehydrogenase family)